MGFLIISGYSGAGKSMVADVLEDMGYYCVDNMPAVLIPRFAELCLSVKGKYDKVALVTDIRTEESFDGMFEALEELRRLNCEYKILFVEADAQVIVQRFSETRRRHPLQTEGELIESTVAREIQALDPVRSRANYIIDTSTLSVAMLKEHVYSLFSRGDGQGGMIIRVISFGFKYGLPVGADMVFDVRFMPNPFYEEGLRKKTGQDKEVCDFLNKWPLYKTFNNKLADLADFLLPLYIKEGKTSLVVAVGCTGGKHRSVAVAEELGKHIRSAGYLFEMTHRDISKE